MCQFVKPIGVTNRLRILSPAASLVKRHNGCFVINHSGFNSPARLVKRIEVILSDENSEYLHSLAERRFKGDIDVAINYLIALHYFNA
jgi:hypothetical protein